MTDEIVYVVLSIDGVFCSVFNRKDKAMEEVYRLETEYNRYGNSMYGMYRGNFQGVYRSSGIHYLVDEQVVH